MTKIRIIAKTGCGGYLYNLRMRSRSDRQDILTASSPDASQTRKGLALWPRPPVLVVRRAYWPRLSQPGHSFTLERHRR